MQPVKLGNEKALQITNSLMIREINNKLNSTYNVDVEYKRYHFLDKTRAAELKQKDHSFVLNTFGAKYLLFLTHINFKPYAIYINRKNSTFFLVKTRFSEKLYNDTILEGESVKINEKWYFLLSDCLVYEGNNIMTSSYSNRYEIIKNIIDEHYISDSFLEPFQLLKKDIFNYSDIELVKEKYIPSLPFSVNGYLFKCENNASYDILYIFPECRNKSKTDTDKSSTSPNNLSPCKRIEENVYEKLDDKSDATFLMKTTEYPEVYEIFMFDKNKGKKARVGYAGIPNIQVSVMVREWFTNPELTLCVKFKKHPINEKWIPQYVISTEGN